MVFVTSDAEALKAKILSGEPTFIRYQAKQPPEIVAEDQEIANFPIPVTEDDITVMDIGSVFEAGS